VLEQFLCDLFAVLRVSGVSMEVAMVECLSCVDSK
jgi:hypothetical protein